MFRTACKRILAVACTLALAAGLTLIPVSAKTPALEAKEQAQATAASLAAALRDDVSYKDGRSVYLILRAGVRDETLIENYRTGLLAGLAADGNAGKLVDAAGYDPTADVLAYHAYAAGIYALLGENPRDIGGHDQIAHLFTDTDSSVLLAENPYHFYIYLQLAEYADETAAVDGLVQKLTSYYDAASGTFSFWGDPAWASVDDVGNAVAALAPYCDRADVKAAVDGALAGLAAKKTETGYMGFDAPASSSTALALAAFAQAGRQAEAEEAYALLANFAVEGAPGQYGDAVGDDVASVSFGMPDALFGLICYTDYQYTLPAAAVAAQQAGAELRKTAANFADFLEGAGVSYTDGRSMYLILDSGVRNEALNAAYLESLRETLAANGGRLPNTGFVASEDDWAYQSYAVLALQKLGLDPTDFEGYDLVAHVAGMDWVATATSPYNYQALLWFAEQFADSLQGTDIVDAAVDALLSYYDAAAGTFVFWGDAAYCSVDDVGNAVAALGPYCDRADVKAAVDGALGWLEGQRQPDGYMGYAGLSSSSTAYALACYAKTGDTAGANAAYAMLSNFRIGDGGRYGAAVGDTEADYAFSMPDVLFGLHAFYRSMVPVDPVEPEPEPQPEPQPEPEPEPVPEGETNPPTGDGNPAAAALAALLALAAVATIKKKRTERVG